jgi:hypothetical protein
LVADPRVSHLRYCAASARSLDMESLEHGTLLRPEQLAQGDVVLLL